MSRFIPYKKLKELQEAARNGNEMAKNIIDKYMDANPDMESIDRLMGEYYNGAPIETLAQVEEQQVEEQPQEEEQVTEEVEKQVEEPLQTNPEDTQQIDITEDLDTELEGLIDNDEFDDISFRDFLKKKKRDGLRARKNADYFKAFDEGGRQSYLTKKRDEFGHSFDGRRRQLERGFNDLNGSIGLYSQMLTDMPEDEIAFDSLQATKAYDEFTDNEDAMCAFGRSWDETDMQSIKLALEALVQAYGKKNVVAMLNTIKCDAEGWKSFSEGRIDNAINSYGKSLESLLK